MDVWFGSVNWVMMSNGKQPSVVLSGKDGASGLARQRRGIGAKRHLTVMAA